MELRAKAFVAELEQHASEAEREKYGRYFKTGPGDYGEGDVFIGVRMGQVFELAKRYIDMPVGEIEALLESPVHEVRAGGASIMDKQARRKKTSEAQRQALFELYMRRHDRLNNWDLVDVCCMHVVGSYLADRPRDVLYELAGSGSIWERRTAIVSTGYFIRGGELDDTFRIAELLMDDREDLIHKATGWMLRYTGDRDRSRLEAFLEVYAATMPRTVLRYAIEKFDKAERARFMAMKSGASRGAGTGKRAKVS